MLNSRTNRRTQITAGSHTEPFKFSRSVSVHQSSSPTTTRQNTDTIQTSLTATEYYEMGGNKGPLASLSQTESFSQDREAFKEAPDHLKVNVDIYGMAT